MSGKSVKIEPFLVIGIALRTNYDNAAKEIPSHWERFYKEGIGDKIPNVIDNRVIALYTDYEGDFTDPYTLIVGKKVSSIDEVPEGMISKSIPKGSYAQFTSAGKIPGCLMKTWQEIWDAPIHRSYTVDFEIFPETWSYEDVTKVEVFVAKEDA